MQLFNHRKPTSEIASLGEKPDVKADYRSWRRKQKRLNRAVSFGIPLAAFGVATLSFGFLVNEASSASPSSALQSTGARIFAEGLNIQFDRTSPAYAALEDAWLEPDLDVTPAMSGAVELVAGTAGDTLAQAILAENKREETLLGHERAAREAQAQALADAATNAIKSVAARFRAPVSDGRTPSQARAQARAQRPTQLHAGGLPAIEHPTRTISLAHLHMSREELVGTLLLPMVTAGKDVVPVIRNGHQGWMPRPTPNNQLPTIIARHNQPPQILNKPGLMESRAEAAAADDEMKNVRATQVADRRPTAEKPDQTGDVYHQVFVSGPIEFTEGLALSNAQDRVIIYRERDGEILESGAVWLLEGRYEIFVEDTEGLLTAELRTPYGDILGRGQFDLAGLPNVAKASRRIEPVALRIHPVPQGIVGHVLSQRVYPKPAHALNEIGLKEASVLLRDLPFEVRSHEKGKFDQTDLLEGSSVVLKALHANYWGSLAFGRAGSETNLDLFPDQPGQLLSDIAAHAKRTNVATDLAGAIWGRVTRGGQPIANATVELSTGDEAIEPVYFNEFMKPDPNLHGTSANGYYALYGVAAGTHALAAKIDETTTEPMIFPVDARSVSKIDIETALDRRAKLKVFDAFRTDWPLAAELSDPARTQRTFVDRKTPMDFRFAGGLSPLIIDADAGEGYQRVRMVMDRERRAIYIPMVQTSWIEKIQASLKINPVAGHGHIVGFVQGPANYRVTVGEGLEKKQSTLVYFDGTGAVSDKDFGTPGGGFIVFNAPEGLRTVTIQPAGTPKVFSSVLLVDPQVTSVLSHWIR